MMSQPLPKRIPAQTLALAIAAGPGLPASAARPVSWEETLKDHASPGEVLSYGLGLKARRYNPAPWNT